MILKFSSAEVFVTYLCPYDRNSPYSRQRNEECHRASGPPGLQALALEFSIKSLNHIDGLLVTDDNQTVLSGAILTLSRRLDRLFCHWASAFGAEERQYPPLVSAAELHKLDYFKSFPHQAIFPASLMPSEENLGAFAENPLSSDGCLQLTEIAPVGQCLAPAACFPIYIAMSEQDLSAPSILTIRSTCFRQEEIESPLTRQKSFTMREVVCVGGKDDVQVFLDRFRQIVELFFERWSLPVTLEQATDPFFNAPANPKYIMQKVAPLKHEMVFDEHLAIGSINFHQNFFGEAFDISCQGSPVFSGCVAFGLERWLFAFLNHFGTQADDWPSFDELTAD